MRDLTQGSVLKGLLTLSAFMLVAMVVQTLYSLIDMFWVGRLGAEAQAAVTTSTTLMFFAMAGSNMIGTGTTALVAQSIGSKDHEAAHHYFNQALGLSLIVTVLFWTGFALGTESFARTFGADSETAVLSVDFLRWFIPAMALQFPMAAAGAALRGTGNMRPGTIAQVATVVLNIILAPLLIFGWFGAPALGVGGAGLATLIATIAGVLGVAVYFLRPKTFLRIKPSHWLPDPATAWEILKIGLPSAAEFSLMTVYMLFITAVLKPFGAAQQAAFGIGQRLMQTGMMPVMAVSFSASALAGQNFGARLPQRVRETFRASVKLSIGSTLVVVAIAVSFPAALIGVFTDDPAVVVNGIDYLDVLSYNLIAIAVAMSCFGVLSGLGNTVPTLISSAVRIALIIGPITYVATLPGFRPIWVWEMSVVATMVQTVLNFYFLRRELNRKLGPVEAEMAAAQSAEPAE